MSHVHLADTRILTIKFGSDLKSQVEATHLLEYLSGRPLSPTCKVCGGVTTEDGPQKARCICSQDKNHKEKEG